MSRGEFSVCQFFADESYDFDIRWVDAETAVKAAQALARSVGAQIGTTQRVIVTDGGDCICFEWIRGKGVVFPAPDAAVSK